MVRVVDWQDELRMKMMLSAKESNARMRKMWGGSSWDKQAISRENGHKGGRPADEAKPKALLKLSAKATSVNKLLLKDLKVAEIADVLGVSHQAVSQMVQRYNLPRSD